MKQKAVKIYKGKNRSGGKVYPQFTLVYYDASGKRVKRNFAHEADAKAEKAKLEQVLGAGKPSGAEKVKLYLAIVKKKSISAVLNEYFAAVKKLPKGKTLMDAVNVLGQIGDKSKAGKSGKLKLKSGKVIKVKLKS